MNQIRTRKRQFLLVILSFWIGLPQTWAQTEKNVTLDLKQVSVKRFFDEVSQQTGLNFIYSAEWAKQQPPITVKTQRKPVSHVLTEVTNQMGCVYEIEGKIVTVMPKDANKRIRTVRGRIRDENGELLVGASVIVLGTDIASITNAQGRYSLNVPTRQVTLQFSYIGTKTTKITLPAATALKELDIVLQTDAHVDEIVVTGYSNIRRKDYVGAATVVKADDIKVGGFTSIDQMLAGNIPGLTATINSGQTGMSPQIKVRGTSTLLGNQNPLWVVDGAIQRDYVTNYNNDNNFNYSTSDSDLRSYAANAISWLNPEDVETITVLKDASATAIYGSAAANGVIVVTTKKGKSGQMNVNYNGELSVGVRPSYGLYDRMNSNQQMTFDYENYQAGYSYPSTPLNVGFAGILKRLYNKEITQDEFNQQFQELAHNNTDWFSLLFRNSVSHRHTASVNGGTNRIRTRASIGYSKTLGEAKGNDMEQYTANITSTMRFNHDIMVNININGNYRDVEGFAYGVNPFSYAYETSRSIKAYNTDGTLAYHDRSGNTSYAVSGKSLYNYNILNERDNTNSETISKSFQTTVDLTIPFLKKFKFKGMLSYNFSNSNIKSYATERSFHISQIRGFEYGAYEPTSVMMKSTRLPYGGVLNTNDQQNNMLNFRSDLIYDDLVSKVHRVTAQLGFETRSNHTEGNIATQYGYMRDRGETFAEVPPTHYYYGDTSWAYDNLLLPEQLASRQVINTKNNYLSGYFLGVYSFDSRYIINISARVDASNRFGQDKNKKYQPTWSIGGKWRLDQESFMKQMKAINSLDISASFGYQGNAVEAVSPYLIAYNGTYNYDLGQYVMRIKSLPYPDLGWEKTRTLNLELNASFLDNRVSLGLDYYKKQSNVLASRNVAFELGMEKAYVTGTEMENSGYELYVSVVPVRTKDWSWSLTFNTGSAKNKITDSNRVNTLYDYLLGTATRNGEAYNTLYSFKFKGLSPEDGTPLFDLGKDENGDAYDGFGYVIGNKIMEEDESYKYLEASGSTIPDLSGGISTRLRYRFLSLDAQFSFRFGGVGRLPALYQYDSYYGCPFPEKNYSTDLLDRWKQPGDELITHIPSVPGVGRYRYYYIPSSTNSFNPYELYYYSNERIAKTDMIRCTQIALTYELYKKQLEWIGIKRCILRMGITNPFFIACDSKWKGIDPETGNWPARRMFTFSVNVTL